MREHGIVPKDFNFDESRRGNHDVMIRGTFANVRLRNQLAEPGDRVLLPPVSPRILTESAAATT